MTGHRIRLPGFKIDRKTGKPVRDERRLPVNVRLAKAGSTRVRVIRKGPAR